MAETISHLGKFYRENTAGGGVYTEATGVLAMTPPNIAAGVGNATDMADTAVQSIKGLPDLGEVTVTLKYDPTDATITALQGDVSAAPGTTDRSYVIGFMTITGGGTAQYRTFTGPATAFTVSEMAAGNDDPLTCQFTVKVNSTSLSATAPSTS